MNQTHGMPAKSEKAATPIAFVRAILLAFDRYAVDPTSALKKALITPSMLRRDEARITATQMEVICDAAMRELDDEALGWFSRRFPWGTYGMLCRASLSSPTLGVALKRWCKNHRLLTDDLLLSFEQAGDVATITLEENRRLGPFREFCLLTSLRYLHGYACWAVDSKVSLASVEFPFPAPPHADVYALMFPGPVAFGASRARLSFDVRYLDLPLRRDERALRSMLQRALPLTVRQYRRDRLLVHRVREILQASPGAQHSALSLADRLNLSARSLHRQLQDEGSSLQGIKDQVRMDLALALIQRTASPIKQVAARTGFRNDKSFSRAFRQWTGISPAQARQGHGINRSLATAPAETVSSS